MTEPFIFNNKTLKTLCGDYTQLISTFREYGVLIFPGVLRKEPLFIDYEYDLLEILSYLTEYSCFDLDHALTFVAKEDKKKLKHLANLGTQPCQFVRGNMLKFNNEFAALAGVLLGTHLVGTPSAGDTLHIFPPGDDMHKYNLPIHQDYQYLMQSPKQLTYYINFTSKDPEIGGVAFWPGSHKEGIKPSYRNANGSWEIEADTSKYNKYDIVWDVGDLAIFDSLTWHKSIPNVSKDKCRMVQLFRFSDLADNMSLSYNWKSTTYKRENVLFEEIHKDKFK